MANIGKIRSIHPQFFTDHGVMTLFVDAPMAPFLLIGLWCHADDAGAFEWKPTTLKARIFPTATIDVTPLLKALVDENFVRQFVDGRGRTVGVIRNFGRFQRNRRWIADCDPTAEMMAFARIPDDKRSELLKKKSLDAPDERAPAASPSVRTRPDMSGRVRLEGEGEGEGEEEKIPLPPSCASEAEKSVEATPSGAEVVRFPIGDDVEGHCRERLRESPAAKDRDFRPVRQLLDGGKAIRADVLSALDDAERKQQRFRSWASFGNWVQQAAKDRVAASRSRAGPRSGRERAPSRTDLLAEMAANGPRGRDDAASGRGLA